MFLFQRTMTVMEDDNHRRDPCTLFSTGLSTRAPMQDPFLFIFIYTTLLLHTPKSGVCLCGKQRDTAPRLAAKAERLNSADALHEEHLGDHHGAMHSSIPVCPSSNKCVPSALQTPVTATSPQHSKHQTSQQHSVPPKDLSMVTATPAGSRPQLVSCRPQLGPGRSNVSVEVAFLAGEDLAIRAQVGLRVGQVPAATKKHSAPLQDQTRLCASSSFYLKRQQQCWRAQISRTPRIDEQEKRTPEIERR